MQRCLLIDIMSEDFPQTKSGKSNNKAPTYNVIINVRRFSFFVFDAAYPLLCTIIKIQVHDKI